MRAYPRFSLVILFSVSVVGLALTSCKNQRTTHSKLTLADVSARLGEVNGEAKNVLNFNVVANIYYAEAPGDFGPVGSLLAIRDFSFLNLDPDVTASLGYKTIKQARVALIDHAHVGGGRDISLLLGLDLSSGFRYFGFSGVGQTGKGVLEADLTGEGRSVTIQTADLNGDELADVVQLKLFVHDHPVGKISTLLLYRK